MIQLSKVFSLISAAAFGIVVSATSFSASKVEESIKERIKPAGEVCMAGEDCAAAPVAAAGGSGEPRSGADVYQTKCFACHGTGAAGAPKLGTAADWAPRIDKGMETLYSSAINGFNTMPPMGTCADCSEEEIKAAVDHMVENSK